MGTGTAMRRWAVATKVYAVGAVLGTVAVGIEVLVVRNQLQVPGNLLLSQDLHRQVWSDVLVQRVPPLVLLPAAAAIATVWVPRRFGVDRVAWPRLANLAPWLWLLGAVLLSDWRATIGRGDMWFNYAPGRGGPYLGAHSWRPALGGVLACVGLGLTAATLVATAFRARPSATDGTAA